jgi:hypothetical protein
MHERKYRYFVGDFETTVDEDIHNQTSTEVWASAIVEMNTDNVVILKSIDATFQYLQSFRENICVYYHNLKFDGSFWLDYFINKCKFKQAYQILNAEKTSYKWLDEKDMKNNTFKYSISKMGQWYTFTIKVNGIIIQVRDSLKLLPFSVKQIGKSFGTKHKKLEMEYKGKRFAGCEITDNEKRYIANDVLVVKEALEILFDEGHDRLTIGSCCLSEFKRIVSKTDYNILFPDLTQQEIDKSIYGYDNADAYIRKAYRGGWCYLVKGKENKIKRNGTTADVNSLYPSMMHSESGNKYPYGYAIFWSGNYIPKEVQKRDGFYYLRVKTRFYLKDGYLPFIQIKDSFLYKSTESLTTSDYYDKETQQYYSEYIEKYSGKKCDTRVTLTLSMIDFELIKEHYNLVDFEILDGCWFYSLTGMFDEYIDKYRKIKETSKGAKRTEAKLFLNNLYGKLASNDDSSFKVAYLKENGNIGFITSTEHEKKAGHIASGAAITSYARNFTIRAAQKNYYGVDKKGFIYADTDSIHCDLLPDEIKGIKVHPTNFCAWKLESSWDEAIFTRQKTYIEHVTHEDLKPLNNPYYNVKCAGMPDTCKELFIQSMTEHTLEDTKVDLKTKEKVDFLKTKRSMSDFKVGLKIPGKLLPKRIKGGVLLTETYYEMR